MVANLNRIREQGVPLFEAVLAGAGERLRPVLMTAAVATVGMLPAALATGVGSDVQRSLATVVAGGLILATLLTLFIIPTFYFVIERRVGAAARGRIGVTPCRCGTAACRAHRQLDEALRDRVIVTRQARTHRMACGRASARVDAASRAASSAVAGCAGCAVGARISCRPLPRRMCTGYHPEPLCRRRRAAAATRRAARRNASCAAATSRANGGRCSAPGRSMPWSRGARNNPDLQAAQAALRVARENAAAQRGAFFPQVDAGFSRDAAAGCRRTSTADVPAPSTFNVFTGQVNVSYAPDVFGANWRAVESLEAQAETPSASSSRRPISR